MAHTMARTRPRLLIIILIALASVFVSTITALACIHRSWQAKHRFEVMTGYPDGRPGYVVDHVIPLACGGGVFKRRSLTGQSQLNPKISV